MCRWIFLIIITFSFATSDSNICYAKTNLNKKVKRLQKKVKKLETTLSKEINGGLIASPDSKAATAVVTTSWEGKIYQSSPTAVQEATINMTFSATSNSEGTFTSSPYPITHPIYAFDGGEKDKKAATALGQWSGSYRIIEDLIFFYNVTGPAQDLVTDGSAIVSVKKGTLIFFSMSTSLPAPLVVLNKIKE